MTANFQKLMFTDTIKALQELDGSRASYQRMEAKGSPGPDTLTSNEIAMIETRDSFYSATVTSDGWPYVQHRGGPVGFLKVLGESTIGFADYRGNRQYLTVGNLRDDDRISMFLVDYPNRARLKIQGRARTVKPDDEPELYAKLLDAEYDAKPERGIIIEVEAFSWNCSQHITPRFTSEQIAPTIGALKTRIEELEDQVRSLGGDPASPNNEG